MAACSKCGINVGCGCQLTNGLCAACNAAAQQIVQKVKNVISKINRVP